MRIGDCSDSGVCQDPTYFNGEAGWTKTPLMLTGNGPSIGPVQPVGQIQPVQSPQIPQQLMPAPTTMVMPGMTLTAQSVGPNPQPSLTPQDLLRPLPTIVDNQPTQIAQCNSFSEWVDANPLLAAGLLLGLAWFTFKK